MILKKKIPNIWYFVLSEVQVEVYRVMERGIKDWYLKMYPYNKGLLS